MKPVLFSIFLLMTPFVGWSQTGMGSIQGSVKDPSGAVVPGAIVMVQQVQTARSYSTRTNETGFYIVPSLQIGPYRVSVEFSGMEPWKGELTLQTGETAVVDAMLKLSGSVSAITVESDAAPMVTTTSATMSSVVERARIEQLPLDTRMIYATIAMTTPGVEIQGSSYVQTNGVRYGTEFLQDGALVENRDSGFVAFRPPGIDTIQEFRVETNNSPAKMSRPSTIIATTKSGTNQIHGSLFETARNNGFGVARRRTDYYDKAPHLVRNEFGASMGGPVFLPKLYNGKNRTFVFGAYEALRLRQSTTRSVTVPSAAMRSGDFDFMRVGDLLGRRITLYDPWSTQPKPWGRTPYPNNQIPSSLQSPLSKYLNSITPMPTLPAVNPLIEANWWGLGFNNQTNYTTTFRVDHRISEKDQFFVRFTHAPHRQSTTNSLNGAPTTLDGKGNGYNSETQNDNFSTSWTRTFSPTLFSETVFSFSRDYWGQVPIGGLNDLSTPLGLPNPFKGGGFPWITGTGMGMDFYPGVNYTLNYGKVFVLDENLTKVMGRHEFQFGGRFRKEILDTLADQQYVQANAVFSSNATALYDPTSGSQYAATRYTGHDSANLFLGIASQYSTSFQRPWFHIRAGEIAGYFQDNFKVNSRLTLNLGVRYEFNSPVKEADNLLIGFDEKTKAVVVPQSTDYLVKMGASLPSVIEGYTRLGLKFETPAQAGLPGNFVKRNLWDFGPRFGFAYRLGQKMALRGGYAIFAYPEALRSWNVRQQGDVPTSASFLKSWNAANQTPDGLPNYLLRSAPTVIAGVNSADLLNPSDPSSITRGAAKMEYLNPDQPTARAHQVNLTVERALMAHTLAKVSYVGVHGVRTGQYFAQNEIPLAYIWYKTTGLPVPTGEYASVAQRPLENTVYGTINEYQKTGWSNNNSFQFEIQRRYSKGYAFQAFYVLANAMRVAGNGWRDDYLPSPTSFLPDAVPLDNQERNRFINYKRNTDVPKHRFNYNWIVDLPFGRGKRFGSNIRGVLNQVVGGWQFAGSGEIRSNWWTLPTSNWDTGKVEIYGKKYKIQDCRSGVCYPGYLYWNGYISPTRINTYAKTGEPTGVMGVPDSYVPSNKPLIPMPKDGGNPSDPNYGNYDTNFVWVPMKNGTYQKITYNDNLNPWRNQYMQGPKSFGLNTSAFKMIRINERAFVRFNADVFNVLNLAGTPQPGSDGIIQMRNSAYSPRILQLTLRVTW